MQKNITDFEHPTFLGKCGIFMFYNIKCTIAK